MKHPGWSRARAIGQILAWLLFVFTLIYTRDPIGDGSAWDIVPRLSAHLGITASLGAGKVLTAFWPALVIILLTLVLGRFFCGWLCPLGVTLDATDRIVNREGHNAVKSDRGPKGGQSLNFKPWKLIVLGGSALLAAAGVQAAGLIDPLSLSVRSYATALYPYFDGLSKLLFNGLYTLPLLRAGSEPLFSGLKATVLDPNDIMFYGHIHVFLVFAGVLLLSRLARRFWCQGLCPLGAVYALTARWGLLRRTVDGVKCTHCLKCEQDCRMNAIREKGAATLEGECIKCFACLKSCAHDAIEFKFTLPFRKAAAISPPKDDVDLTRRGLLMGALSTAFLVPLFRLNPEYKKDFADLIRPPGALPEERFLDTCIRCGECMKVCPTNALHPALTEAGLEGLFTPRLIPRIGWCEKNCNLCTVVCPTGALRKVRIDDKEKTFIGTAYFVKDLCIPWAENRDCLVCEEVCPTQTKSIILKRERAAGRDGKEIIVKRPYILEDVCIGCGICENKCPVAGSGAIRVRTLKKGSDAYG